MPYWNDARELEQRQHNPGELILYSNDGTDGPLEVVEDLASRSLRFGNQVRQSSMLLADPVELLLPYTRAMMAAEMFLEQEPARALVLGLGGGSLVKFIHFHHPDCLIDAVEARADVVDAAYQYFNLPGDERVRVIPHDGADYVAGCGDKYDLLLIDMFDGRGMAEGTADPAFFGACRGLLEESGIAAVNLWNVDPQQYRLLAGSFGRSFAPHVLKLPLGRQANVILLGFPRPLPPHCLHRLGARVTGLETSLGLEFSHYLKLLKRHNPPGAAPLQGLV